MGRAFYTTLTAIATLAIVQLTLNKANTDSIHRSLRLGTLERKSDVIARRQREIVDFLHQHNDTLSTTYRTAAHSYCDGNDVVEYPFPKYDACDENSTLNIIPFFGGMTNGMKFIVLGALMSFQEGRCFIIGEEEPPVNGGPEQIKAGIENAQKFTNHYFEGIGLSPDHPFVEKALAEGRYRTRKWKEYWDNRVLRRTEGANYNYKTPFYSHPDPVDGVALKRHFLRHMWHLRPNYRDATCQSLKDQDIFDSDYIGISIRRGDKTKENFKFPSMDEYVKAAEPIIPSVFGEGQTPKFFVATDDCSMVDELRQLRPQWVFKTQCDLLAEKQNGYNNDAMKTLDEAQQEEHFRKFFVELYALAFSKVYSEWFLLLVFCFGAHKD